MLRYVVTTYPGATGANLSKPGHWGNIPYTSTAAAETAARHDAGNSPYVIDRERGVVRKRNPE